MRRRFYTWLKLAHAVAGHARRHLVIPFWRLCARARAVADSAGAVVREIFAGSPTLARIFQRSERWAHELMGQLVDAGLLARASQGGGRLPGGSRRANGWQVTPLGWEVWRDASRWPAPQAAQDALQSTFGSDDAPEVGEEPAGHVEAASYPEVPAAQPLKLENESMGLPYPQKEQASAEGPIATPAPLPSVAPQLVAAPSWDVPATVPVASNAPAGATPPVGRAPESLRERVARALDDCRHPHADPLRNPPLAPLQRQRLLDAVPRMGHGVDGEESRYRAWLMGCLDALPEWLVPRRAHASIVDGVMSTQGVAHPPKLAVHRALAWVEVERRAVAGRERARLEAEAQREREHVARVVQRFSRPPAEGCHGHGVADCAECAADMRAFAQLRASKAWRRHG